MPHRGRPRHGRSTVWVAVMNVALKRAFPSMPPPKSRQYRHINCRIPHVVHLRRLTEDSGDGDGCAAAAA